MLRQSPWGTNLAQPSAVDYLGGGTSRGGVGVDAGGGKISFASAWSAIEALLTSSDSICPLFCRRVSVVIAQREAWDIIHSGNVDIVHGRANSVSLKRVLPQPRTELCVGTGIWFHCVEMWTYCKGLNRAYAGIPTSTVSIAKVLEARWHILSWGSDLTKAVALWNYHIYV